MTAIAAVLALSSPSLAQDAGATPAPAPDTVVTTPDPVAPDPLAPEVTTTTTATDAPAEPAVAPPAAKRTAAKPAARTTRSTTARTAATRSASAAPTASTAAVARAAPAPAPIQTPLPEAQVMPAPAAPAAAEPVVEPAAADQGMSANDILPIAGAAGLGLLALTGAGIALRRRKRRREEELADGELADSEWVEPMAEPAAVPEQGEPMFVRASTVPLHDSVPARAAIKAPVMAAAPAVTPIEDAPTNELPAGFDISRFGRHVQAAYRGPTADNPSLSLKNRLRRASFFDQREKAGLPTGIEGQSEPAPKPSARPAAEPAWMGSNGRNTDFMFGRDKTKMPADPVTQH